MRVISLGDPAWQTTFPHRLTPLPDEWLAGFLLRCDEVNHWGSGTTLSLLRHHTNLPLYYRRDISNLMVLSAANLAPLAGWLAISKSALLATTYHDELTRISDVLDPPPEQLAPAFSFRFCPQCLDEARKIPRTLLLPQVKCCPQHRIVLQKRCQCGTLQQLFHRQSSPFTCYKCGLHWARLPKIQAEPSRIALEQKHLEYYAFFFSSGTLRLLDLAWQLLSEKLIEKTGNNVFLLDGESEGADYFPQEALSLGSIVAVLVSFDLSPQDLLGYARPYLDS